MTRFFIFFTALMALGVPANAFDSLWDDEKPEQQAPLALPITLRAKAVVKDDVIRLGDLFSGLDSAKDARVAAEAPAAGKDVILTADWLKKLADKNAIAWTPSDSGVSITVKRASVEISKAELMPVLMKTLKEKGVPEQAEVTLYSTGFPLMIPAETAYEISFEETDYAPGSKTFKTKAVIRLEDKIQTVDLSGKVHIFAFVPTARQNLAPGQIITEADIFMKKTPQEGIRRDSFTPLSDLIGKEVKRGIRAGQTVDESDVRTRVMVTKGKMITLSFTKGGIMLSAQGKALENGGLGDTVRVMNTQSKSVVQGTVTGPETVVISPFQTGQKK